MARRYVRHLKTVGDKSIVGPHTHATDHWSYCVRGRIMVKLDEDEIEMGPDTERILVKAAHMHSAWALEPDSIMVCDFRDWR